MESFLSAINSEITKLSGTGIDRILETIKNQCWYFFKNKIKSLCLWQKSGIMGDIKKEYQATNYESDLTDKQLEAIKEFFYQEIKVKLVNGLDSKYFQIPFVIFYINV